MGEGDKKGRGKRNKNFFWPSCECKGLVGLLVVKETGLLDLFDVIFIDGGEREKGRKGGVS